MHKLYHLILVNTGEQGLILFALFANWLLDILLQVLFYLKDLLLFTMSLAWFLANDNVCVDMNTRDQGLDDVRLYLPFFENLPSLHSFQKIVHLSTLFQQCCPINVDHLLPSDQLQKP